jgi:hypothetical protein
MRVSLLVAQTTSMWALATHMYVFNLDRGSTVQDTIIGNLKFMCISSRIPANWLTPTPKDQGTWGDQVQRKWV